MSFKVINTQHIVTPQQSMMGLNAFTVQLYKNKYFQENSRFWKFGSNGMCGFTAVAQDNIQLSFSTDWTDAGGAKLGKKVSNMISSTKIFKALAAQSDKGFQPIILSDAWTQKKVSGTSPLKVSLKFKLYYNQRNVAGSHDYKQVIMFLTHLCSPAKPVQMGTDSVRLVKNALDGAYNIGSELMKDFKGAFTRTDQEGVAGYIAAAVNVADSTVKNLTSTSWGGINNGNFTVLFNLGDRLFTHQESQSDNLVDWIVNSFSFTPSTQFHWDEKSKLPLPLWCDFTLDLETRFALSNKSVYDIMHKNKIVLSTQDVQ